MRSCTNYRVLISNLPNNANEDRLNTIFSDIDFIKISLAKSLKGNCKGYGHIDLSCEKDVKKVLELNGYVFDGKKLKIEEENEELNEIKKCNSNSISSSDISSPSRTHSKKEEEKDPQEIKEYLENKSKEFNKQIFCNDLCNQSENNDIVLSLSTCNCQLVCELKHLFPNLSDKEFHHQVHRNDELKKIYHNCCSHEHTTEEKLQKIKHLKFDDNPLRDENLKTLCSVLVKSFENNPLIDFNICNRLSSNLKAINSCYPGKEETLLFKLHFSKDILGEHTFKEFAMDKRKQKIFEMNLQKKIGEILQVPFGEVVFLKVRDEVTVNFCGVVHSKMLLRNKQEDNNINEYVYNVLKKKLSDGLGKVYPINLVEVALQDFKCKLSLNPCDFDNAGDYYFRTKKGDKQTRGGLPYYQPSKKWKRFGLRVAGMYENDDWLNMDGNPNEWAVAFHSTQGEQNYCETKDPSFKQQGPKSGIHFAQNVEDCNTQIIEWEGEKYVVAFQCRIHPDHVWMTGNRTIVVVDNPVYVRPYGIVMKNIKKDTN